MDTSSAPARGTNHDEAVRALEEGTRFLELREYERAFRLLRRSFTLEASPAAAAAMARVREAVATDSRYCATCVRWRGNCVCGSSGVPQARGDAAASPPPLLVAVQDGVAAVARGMQTLERQARRGLLRLGVRPEYVSPICWVWACIAVAAVLRLLLGRPIVDVLSPSSRPAAAGGRGGSGLHIQVGPSWVSSLVLTVGVNALLYYATRRRAA